MQIRGSNAACLLQTTILLRSNRTVSCQARKPYQCACVPPNALFICVLPKEVTHHVDSHNIWQRSVHSLSADGNTAGMNSVIVKVWNLAHMPSSLIDMNLHCKRKFIHIPQEDVYTFEW